MLFTPPSLAIHGTTYIGPAHLLIIPQLAAWLLQTGSGAPGTFGHTIRQLHVNSGHQMPLSLVAGTWTTNSAAFRSRDG